MTLTHSEYVRGGKRVPASQYAGEVVAVRYELAYAASAYSDGDIVELGVLPAHHTVRDMVVDSTDVDDGTDFEWDLGLMSGEVGEALDEDDNARTCGDEFFDSGTLGRDAGVDRMSNPAGFKVTPTDKDRSIGLKLIDQGTTTGTFGVTVFYGT